MGASLTSGDAGCARARRRADASPRPARAQAARPRLHGPAAIRWSAMSTARRLHYTYAEYRALEDTSDLRIRIPATGLSTYPDAAVICGRTQRAVDDPLAVTNPVLIIELTSPSTEEYDRGEKLRHYQRLPSVREVLIASHARPELTLHRREADAAWTVLRTGRGRSVDLIGIGTRLTVDDVYRDVEDIERPS